MVWEADLLLKYLFGIFKDLLDFLNTFLIIINFILTIVLYNAVR